MSTIISSLKNIRSKLPPQFPTWWQNFQRDYAINSSPGLKQYTKNVMQMAQRIKREQPYLLGNISYFLYRQGIVLLLVKKKELPALLEEYKEYKKHIATNEAGAAEAVKLVARGQVGENPKKTKDGFASFYEGTPFIVIAEDIKTSRRRFFIIAHELYHLLAGEQEKLEYGEKIADKFAGALLLGKDELQRALGLEEGQNLHQEANIGKHLRTLYRQFPISLQCIVNTLDAYKLIDEEQRFFYAAGAKNKERQNLIKSWQLPPDSENILATEELLQRYEMQKDGSLTRRRPKINLRVYENFDEELPADILEGFGL